jgi:hypothetical protein
MLNRINKITHVFNLAPKASKLWRQHMLDEIVMTFVYPLLAFSLAFVIVQVLACMLYSLTLSMYMPFWYTPYYPCLHLKHLLRFFLIFIIIVQTAVLAIILVGLLYGFFIAIICGQRITDRHYHVLAKQELTKVRERKKNGNKFVNLIFHFKKCILWLIKCFCNWLINC